jgi:hypothetical protein
MPAVLISTADVTASKDGCGFYWPGEAGAAAAQVRRVVNKGRCAAQKTCLRLQSGLHESTFLASTNMYIQQDRINTYTYPHKARYDELSGNSIRVDSFFIE